MEQISDTLSSDVMAESIMKLIYGARNFKLLENAIEIGIFDDLETAQHPVPAERLASKHKYNTDKMTRFLDALCALELIGKTTNNKGKGLYYNLTGSSKYLTRSRRPSLVALTMLESKMILPLLDKLPCLMENGNNFDVMSNRDGVKTTTLIDNDPLAPVQQDKPITDQSNNNPAAKGDHESQMKFLMCMESMSLTCVQALARAFDLNQYASVVDLGGGSGAIGIELAKIYQSLDVVIFELPNVVQVAKKMNQNLPENLSFYQGNFFSDALPAADLYILSHVIHDWDDENVATLLKNVRHVMKPGGSLLIFEKVLNADKDGPVLASTQNFMMSLITKGRERTEQEYRLLLTSHGFTDIVVKKIQGYNTYDAIKCQPSL